MKSLKQFWRDEKGVVTVEYVVFVAAIGILLVLGVWVLINGMGDLFGAYSNYFRPPS